MGLELKEVQPLIIEAKQDSIKRAVELTESVKATMNDKVKEMREYQYSTRKELTEEQKEIANAVIDAQISTVMIEQDSISRDNQLKDSVISVNSFTKDINKSVNNSIDNVKKDLNSTKNFTKDVKISLDNNVTYFEDQYNQIWEIVQSLDNNFTEEISLLKAELKYIKEKMGDIETKNYNAIGLVSFSLLQECPAGYVEVNGQDISSYELLTDKVRMFDLPDYGNLFIRIDTDQDDRQAMTIQEDATAVNGLTVQSAGRHTHSFDFPVRNIDNLDGSNGFVHGNEEFRRTFWMSYAGEHTHNLLGDAETRPKNVNLKLCVKAE